MKRIGVVSLALLICLSLPFSTAAHPSSQSSIIQWGENIGWGINENMHSNGSILRYALDSTAVPHRSTISSGAALWGGTLGIVENAPLATGVISVYSSMSGISGGFNPSYAATDSAGHLTYWEIRMNSYYGMSLHTIAHEFGHAIGLVDLGESKNRDKLMYGYDSRTATTATAADRKGAEVILGIHSTHAWGYRYSMTLSIGLKCHQQYCTVCDGFVPGHSVCIYNAQNICTLCGTPK